MTIRQRIRSIRLIHRKSALPTHLDWRPDPIDGRKARWFAFVFGYGVVFAISLFLMIAGLFTPSQYGFIEGMAQMFRAPSVLLTDYFAVAGIGPTLFQSGLFLAVFTTFAYLCHFPMNGLLLSALMTSCGFSFFGKNLLNAPPLVLGVLLYIWWQRADIKDYLIIGIFSTCLSPIVSQLTFGYGWPIYIGFPIGFLAGLLAGFAMPILAKFFLRFHFGFNLYNAGFTAGTIGAIYASVLRVSGHDVAPISNVLEGKTGIVAVLIAIFAVLLIAGTVMNRNLRKHYRYLIGTSGRLYADYTEMTNFQTAIFNMGVLGLQMTAIVWLLGGTLSGPVVGGILTVSAFGALGKHPRNVTPIMLGVLLGGWLFGFDYTSPGFLVTLLFSTTLAPIAGHFGWFSGMLAGVLHLALVTNLGYLHGGMNLYNNGFSGGIVAAFLAPLLATFAPGDDLTKH